MKSSCIASWTVPRWDEFGKWSLADWSHRAHGDLMGWASEPGGGWRSFALKRPEHKQLSQCVVNENWTCDISDVHGFFDSKSDLERFTSMDEMVETNSREMIDQITLAKLEKNLAHSEIRIFRDLQSGSDYFARYRWDNRLWLMNSGGSHHFAAAKYIATRIGHLVPLKGRLYEYSLNASAITSLCRDFEIFAVGDSAAASNAFSNAMQSVDATWLWHPMPKVYEGSRAIYLPRKNKRSMSVARMLREAEFVDLGALLTSLAHSH